MNKAEQLPIIFHDPQFLLGAHDTHQFPEDGTIEVAFAGRSNVGKSSAINTITNRRKLARTSKTPGRTQQINFFALSSELRLVDLPGYGFAQVPIKIKQHWQKTIQHYLHSRRNLVMLVLLMDIRHPLTELDQKIIESASKNNLRTHILLTKSDKFKRGKAKTAALQVEKYLKKIPGQFSVQTFSSQNHDGVNTIRTLIAEQIEH